MRVIDTTTAYSEQTMSLVFGALMLSGLGAAQARDAINTMQSVGVLFRERS
jgi:hypothetical protein